MADTLSQADIDALLNTFGESAAAESSSGSGKGTGGGDEGSGEAYDFGHPELLSRDQMRALRTLHEGFAQAVAKRLSTEFLANVSAAVVSIDQLTYGEFLMLLPSPTVLSVVEIPSLEGNIAIELNPNIAFTFVDRLLGGVGQPLAKVRSLSAIEQGLMERVVTKCCQELAGVWAPIQELEFELQSIEGNPELARVVGPNEIVVLVSLELRMNDVAGMMNLCLPYVVLETAIHKLGQGTTYRRARVSDHARDRKAIETSVRRTTVPVEIDLGRVDLTLGEILALSEGDVLRIHSVEDAKASAIVEGVARMIGSPGRSHGNLAFRVESIRRDVNDEGRRKS